MKKSISASLLPSVESPLRELGQHIRTARQSRGWTVAEAAARMVISPATYKRIEAGDPSVSMASWATALSQLQLLGKVVTAAAPINDPLGEALRADRLSKRIRKPKKEDDYDF
ncbi:helix-turn-helix domain-containing protein [Chitinimonas sp. BJB300]|uniref:helix-turn-helix domain-containing protein n=1 Tax=Chitinimonas sp. BJB300 TaxID=1559339 RepID=UPI000C121478|nr:helix-turn-helix transcriptional regulator [Chitinimonas sp. BJB300]PHV11447.1 transcriptional regulator [Chitinimonas sp. BJB300]TSJ87226.1 helix-turn-helix domain-containing protein [Chitinimonas sp. BJB300]